MSKRVFNNPESSGSSEASKNKRKKLDEEHTLPLQEQKEGEERYKSLICPTCLDGKKIWPRGVNTAINIKGIMMDYINSQYDINSRHPSLCRGTPPAHINVDRDSAIFSPKPDERCFLFLRLQIYTVFGGSDSRSQKYEFFNSFTSDSSLNLLDRNWHISLISTRTLALL
ncbi:hypothetical protein BDF21DRAFT_403837 [Thamnidium elegans]|nr:hypothetical protein BDF21DRAFT_403837 [Thamnidium elegans]